MTFAISGMRPSQSNAEHAKQQFVVFDTIKEAMTEAEKWLRSGVIDISLWEQRGIPTIRTVVDWEQKKCP